MSHHTKISTAILVQFILPLSLLGYATGAFAHHPHDNIDAIAISPSYTQDNTLFIANEGHLFRSIDGGYSWNELVKGLDHLYLISSIDIARVQESPLTVYMSTLGDGIFQSKDGGNSWANINGNISNLAIQTLSVRPDGNLFALDTKGQLNISNDQGVSWHTARFPDNAPVTSMSPAVTASNNSILAGTATGEIYLSDDNGDSWTSLGRVPAGSAISLIAFDPSDTSGTSFFIGTSENGLFKSSDKGASFQSLDKGLPGTHITSLAFSPSYKQDHTLYANTWRDAIFISVDEGNTWKRYSQGLTTSKQADTVKYRSPHFREIKVVDNDSQTLFLAGFDGLFKSTDQGHNWEEVETLAVKLIKSLDVSSGQENGTYSVAIGTYGGGAYISHNKGKSWTIGNKGLNTTRIGDIKFSPSYPNDGSLFAGAMGYVLYSDTRGSSWEKIPLGHTSLKKRIVNKLVRLGLPKDIRKKLLDKRDIQPVYPSSIAISPNYAIDNTIFIGTRYHGLYLLNTDRMEFENVWEDAKGVISTIALSPDFPDDQTAFLFVRGDNLYKSTDKGYSWLRSSDGLPFNDTRDNLEKSFTHKRLKVVFSPLFKQDQTLYVAGPIGIFESTDRGNTWRALANTSLGPEPNIQALAISPDYNNDKMLLVSLKGQGLFRSMDGGSSFTKTGNALIDNNQSIELVAFSSKFAQDKVIYAASDQDLFLSSDKGDNWTRLNRPVRYEDRRNAIKYTGNWNSTESDEFSASTVHYSETPGDKAKLNFSGCGIRWLATRSPQGGIADVYIDDALVNSVNLHSVSVETMSEVFVQNDLNCGPHTIRIELSETGNEAAQTRRVTLDAFDVLPPK